MIAYFPRVVVAMLLVPQYVLLVQSVSESLAKENTGELLPPIAWDRLDRAVDRGWSWLSSQQTTVRFRKTTTAEIEERDDIDIYRSSLNDSVQPLKTPVQVFSLEFADFKALELDRASRIRVAGHRHAHSYLIGKIATLQKKAE